MVRASLVKKIHLANIILVSQVKQEYWKQKCVILQLTRLIIINKHLLENTTINAIYNPLIIENNTQFDDQNITIVLGWTPYYDYRLLVS